jgi:hypothetical protein
LKIIHIVCAAVLTANDVIDLQVLIIATVSALPTITSEHTLFVIAILTAIEFI